MASGFAGFTIEGVALRSGAAKTTIYRWWPSKSVLAVEAFLEVAQLETAFPSTDLPLADLKAQIRLVARAFRGPSGRTLAGIIAAMQSDPETARAFIAGFVEPRRGAARQAVQRGIASGELRADLDLEATLDCLYGPLYHRLLVGHRGLDDGAVDALVDVVLDGVGQAHRLYPTKPRTRREPSPGELGCHHDHASGRGQRMARRDLRSRSILFSRAAAARR